MDKELNGEEFTIALSGIAARYPLLNITTSLVRDGEVVLSIPPDDVAILDAEELHDER